MKKLLLILTGVGITVMALGAVGFAFAQGNNPPDFPPNASGEFGRGGHGAGMHGEMGDNPLHDVMSAAIADAFGLTVEELDAMHENGETLYDWATEEGLTPEEFQAKMLEARESSLQQAVEDGTITQEQADQMLDHSGGPGFGGQIPGAGPCQDGEFSPQGMPHGGRGQGGRGNW